MMSRAELATALREFGMDDVADATLNLRPPAQDLLLEVWKAVDRILNAGGTRGELEMAVEAYRRATCS